MKEKFGQIPTKYFVAGNIILAVVIGFVFFRLSAEPKTSPAPAEGLLSAEQVQQTALAIFQKCTPQNGKEECYKKELMDVTFARGLQTGEQILYMLQDKDDFTKNCHVLAHFMSRQAYKKNPADFDRLLETVDVNACGSGFLHGVLEAYTGDHPEIPVDGKFATQMCDRGNDDYRKRMCAHFMGHILLLNAYGNLDEAVPLCESVKPEWQFDCYDGMFMEDHQKLALSEHEIAPLPKLDKQYMASMEATCLKYDRIKARACWTEMAEMHAHAYGYDPELIYKGCAKAPTAEFAQACYFKGVIVMSIYLGFDTKDKLLSLCKYYDSSPGVYKSCTQNIISSLMYYSPKYAPRGVTLCSNIKDQYKEDCFGQLTGLLKSRVPAPAERALFCEGMPDKHKQVCLQ